MILEVEKPLLELEEKIAELKKVTEGGVDLSGVVRQLERKAEELKHSIYSNPSAWDRVQIARHDQRPKTLDYIRELFTQFHELHGDRHYADDAAVVAGLARFEGRAVLVVGHQKGKDTKENLYRNFGMPAPEGFRKAQRLFLMAQRFKLPIITFVDTSGAYPGIEAEERGQYEAIASSIALMTELTVPIVTVVIGEGGSGGAIAIATADRIYMLEHSIYSVISPEGCASILWKDAEKMREAAHALKLTAQDLKKLGVIDEIIPEPLGGAQRAPAEAIDAVGNAIFAMLGELEGKKPAEIIKDRRQKFLAMGSKALA